MLACKVHIYVTAKSFLLSLSLSLSVSLSLSFSLSLPFFLCLSPFPPSFDSKRSTTCYFAKYLQFRETLKDLAVTI